MKKFNVIKTIQLVFLLSLTLAALAVIFTDRELYAAIAADRHVRVLCFLLWVTLGLSFLCLFYDFNSWSDLRRENMELDNAVYSDALTGVANRYSVDVYLGRYLNQPLPADTGCVTLDLTSLKEINSCTGHEGGDEAIRAFSDILQNSAEGVFFIGRNGGNKFLAIFRECSRKRLDRFMEEVEKGTEAWNREHPVPIRYSSGLAFDEGPDVHTLTELVALSDRRAFQAGLELAGK